MPSTFPKCPYCGHEFRYQTGYYTRADPSYINLQEQWSHAHKFGYNRNDRSGAWTTVVTCPSCGKRCEVGYKCTMRAVSRKKESNRRDAEIIAKRASGMTLQAIGDEYGLTRQRINQICKEGDDD